MPYLSNFGQLGESWTLEDLPMPKGLNLLITLFATNIICVERSHDKLVFPSPEHSNHGA
jgi:hypothetical protein